MILRFDVLLESDPAHSSEYTLSYKIQNEVHYSMPSAGSIGIGWTSIGGIALMLLAI